MHAQVATYEVCLMGLKYLKLPGGTLQDSRLECLHSSVVYLRTVVTRLH